MREKFAVLYPFCSSFSFSWGKRQAGLGCTGLLLLSPKHTVPELTAGRNILKEALASVWKDSLVGLLVDTQCTAGGAWGGGDTLGADTQCGVGSARGGDDSVPIAGDYTPECPVDDTL